MEATPPKPPPTPQEQYETLGRELMIAIRKKELAHDMGGVRALIVDDYPLLAANPELVEELSESQTEIFQQVTEERRLAQDAEGEPMTNPREVFPEEKDDVPTLQVPATASITAPAEGSRAVR